MRASEVALLFLGGVVALALSIRAGQIIGAALAQRKRSAHKGFENSTTNDLPLTDPQEDRLGYAPFAQHLAQSVLKMRAPRGFVLAVTGGWGTGKTTLLNFMEHYLTEAGSQRARPEVVRFTPWWFAGREELTRRFFDQLQLAVKGLDIYNSAAAAELHRLEDALAQAGAPGIFRSLLTLGLPQEPDIPQIKEKVSDRLASQDQRIVVFIDDIDRLDAREIIDVFMLVKAVGDFPNVIYVLAFDFDVVKDALQGVVSGQGDAYVEKIIQTSFDLPAPDPVALREIFLSDLNEIVSPTPEELFDSSHWANVFWDGIASLLTTPRRVVRVLNAIRVTYPPISKEVNGVDFVALEILRVVANDLYHLIRNNPQHFLGDIGADSFPRTDTSGEHQFHRAWEEELSTALRAPVAALVRRLFPRVEAALSGSAHNSSGMQDTWKRQRRLCHPDVFPVFFQLSVPEGSQSRAEIAALIAIAGDHPAFSQHLIDSASQRTRAGTSRVRQELEELVTFAEDIPDEAVPSIIRTLFDIGDQLLIPEDEGDDFIGFGNDIRMGRLAWVLLGRFAEPQRFQYLYDALRDGRALTLAVDEATTLAQQHGEFDAEPRPPDERILGPEHLELIKVLVVQKIERAAAEGRLAEAKDLGSILYRWKTWGDARRVEEWVQDLVKTDRGFLQLIEAFTGTSRRLGQGDLVARIQRRLSLRSLGEFIDLEEAVSRARHLNVSPDLQRSDLETVRLLLSTAEDLASGRNPNFPFEE